MSRVANVDADGHVLAVPRAKPVRPPMYNVLLHNDDYTPADFVVMVLQSVFGMGREQAVAVMLHAHARGLCSCGTFTRDVAETKAGEAMEACLPEGHALRFTAEPQ